MATLATPPPAANGSSHPFTCNTCQVAFRSSDLQRTHMQSDWHRYNLKRRVASLPPLTSDVFAEKVLANKASAAATAARASFEKRCEACDKTYFSEGAYLNHLGSQKHRILTARIQERGGNETESMADSTFSLGEPMENASTTTGSTVNGDVGDRGSDDDELLDHLAQSVKATSLNAATASATSRADQSNEQQTRDPQEEEYEHKANLQQCLFCNYISPTLDLSLNHMGRQHGFFVPERDYLVDLGGLINYLSETIHVLHQCLLCHKTVHTKSGVQTHMRDRGHCMIAYSTEEEQVEIGDFYDFRSTYSDEETDEDEGADPVHGGVSLGVKRDVQTTVHNDDGKDMDVEDDEGWESDSTLSSVPTDEITSVPIEHQDHKFAKLDLHRHHSHSDPRPHKNTDGFHSHAHHTPTAVYHVDYELHLPSGRTAGHRSLKTYYRQNLRNYPTAEERAEQARQQQLIDSHRHDSDADDSDADDRVTQTQQSSERGRRQLVTRADGGLGMVGVSDAKKKEVRAQEKRDRVRQQRAENRYRAGNERRNNFQKHFRDPLLQ